MHKRFAVLIGMIVVFSIATLFSLVNWLNPSSVYPEAKDGRLDAAQWNFAEQGILTLRGEWEFYEDQLLAPADFRKEERPAGRRLMQVPSGWNNALASGNERGYGSGTYRLLVNVNESALYSLRAKKIRLSHHVYINGVDLGGAGQPAVAAEQFVPSNIPFFGTVRRSPASSKLSFKSPALTTWKAGSSSRRSSDLRWISRKAVITQGSPT